MIVLEPTIYCYFANTFQNPLKQLGIVFQQTCIQVKCVFIELFSAVDQYTFGFLLRIRTAVGCL